MNYALIVAAGKGTRFGGAKQFSMLGDHPVVYYPLSVFEDCRSVREIVFVVNRESVSCAHEIVEKYGFKKIEKIVIGGRERQDSVRKGLHEIGSSGIVIIHDGARPFITKEMVERGVNVCEKKQAVVYGLRVKETLKEVERGKVIRTVERKNLYQIQTPQFFDIFLVKRAHAAASPGMIYTDDAMLVERLGEPVYLLEGDSRNIKITERHDLILAQQILLSFSEKTKIET